jgi:hypothetical protein
LGNLRERDHFQDQGIDGRIILHWNLGMHWTDVALDRGRWWAFVIAEIKLWVP